MSRGDPSGNGLFAVAEEVGNRAYGQNVRFCAPFGEEIGRIRLNPLIAQIGLFSALLDRCKDLREFDRVDAPRASEHILAEYDVASCLLASVDAWDESVLEHPGAFSFADM